MNKKILAFIEDFNSAWIKGDINKLTSLLDENIVFVTPDLKTEIRGRDNCIQTIREYLKQAETRSFEVLDRKIHIWKNTAVVSIDYYVEYVLNDTLYKENGKEFWTLQDKDNSWKMVWRAVVMNEEVK